MKTIRFGIKLHICYFCRIIRKTLKLVNKYLHLSTWKEDRHNFPCIQEKHFYV